MIQHYLVKEMVLGSFLFTETQYEVLPPKILNLISLFYIFIINLK